MNEFIEQFLLESREYVEQASADLLALEKAPGDKERLDNVFRAFHTLKGGAGIVDFTGMAEAVHAAESALAAARSGARVITRTFIQDCLACIDQVARWLDIMEATGELPKNAQAEADTVIARFALSAGEGDRMATPQPAASSVNGVETVLASHAREPNSEQSISLLAREILEAQVALLRETAVHASQGRMASAGVVAANVLRNAGRASDAGDIARATESSLAGNDPRSLLEAIDGVLSVPPSPVIPAGGGKADGVSSTDMEVTARTLRIDAARIDALVNLTGELTVAKNSIGHATTLAQQSDPALASILKHRYAVLDHLVGELQRSVLEMRVLPLRHVFQRFSRLVREISANLGKPASLVIEGGETEADKAIVEMLFEPLLHVLRNAMDHGIESAAVRAAQGKPAVATIRLYAGRQDSHVIVEMGDDGQGVDVARIRQVALERKVMPDHELAALSDAEVINLIFEAGFSTADKVTGLSGRGVGMDAVRSAVARVGGDVRVESRAGAGTTVRLTLPFSVMMTRVMVVHAAQQSFGIPLDAVIETLRIPVGRIAPVGAAHAIVLRNQTIPLVSLADILGLKMEERDETEATIVVTKVDGSYGALRVDQMGERMEVMLKPLEGLLAGMPGLAGSTLLGDGSVLLVLDLGGLFQ